MPKNKKGGKKHKRGKKNNRFDDKPKNIETADIGQDYAKVISRQGGSRLKIECTDGNICQAIIPGKFRKRVWMNPGDVLLVSLAGTGNELTCTIDKKYTNYEIFKLKEMGLIEFEIAKGNAEELNFEFSNSKNKKNIRNVNGVANIDTVNKGTHNDYADFMDELCGKYNSDSGELVVKDINKKYEDVLDDDDGDGSCDIDDI
jgi:translation initiation factor 1A